MSVLSVRLENDGLRSITQAVERFVGTLAALRLDAIKPVPSRALQLLPSAERDRLFGALRAAEQVVVVNLTHLAGVHRGEGFSVGLVVAQPSDELPRVTRIFDAIPLAELIDALEERLS